MLFKNAKIKHSMQLNTWHKAQTNPASVLKRALIILYIPTLFDFCSLLIESCCFKLPCFCSVELQRMR